ncbi:NERD domain-containing protein [Paenibacillus sp. sptzw28]|uniref:nuclease-related domain-containing protein n=1 Tax=Paenibacillus sp. sptzw28 TaxID=715179 RepID=UPI001C6F5C3D|nr:nuclease-related domain-containing protein [Paenibacillus sp. sptzw28]QYR20991.1 NERD domain-containing protein [Paenibacillus sp. sptzw28]
MAISFPDHPQTRTSGEKALIDNLKIQLSDIWHIFYEPIIDGVKPDIVLFSPYHGALIVEVKDWNEKTIKHVSVDAWTIETEDGEKRVNSPLKQAADYSYKLLSVLAKSPILMQQEGNYKGRLLFPVGYMCYFTNLPLERLEALKITSVIPDKFILSLDVHDDHLEYRVIEVLNKHFSIQPLSVEATNEVKHILYPEVTIEINNQSYFSNKSVMKFSSLVDEILYICTEIRHLQKVMSIEKVAIIFDIDRVIRKRTLSEEVRLILKDMGIDMLCRGGYVELISLAKNDHGGLWDIAFIIDCYGIIMTDEKEAFLEMLSKKASVGSIYYTSHSQINFSQF